MAKDEKGAPVRSGDPRVNKPEVQLNDEAFGIARDKEGKYFLVELKYDFESGEAKIVSKIQQATRGEAFERFKIKVAQSSVMGE